ncbi:MULTISPECIES: hypothetical protein [Sphingobacterium]|uniref:Phosphatidate cytidylyltransferase n=1 Tax=Sphingobacterium populi TaxID=1812824 RepID=A0ABW5UAB4_9SPHI|nr:hypothetical protein [Sphingobacterium sp. CFCC 11742]
MKRFIPMALLFTLVANLMTSCQAIEGIFKAGMWTGVIVVVAIVALIIWIISKVAGGKK